MILNVEKPMTTDTPTGIQTSIRKDIYSAVLDRMRRWYGQSYIDSGRACLYFMHTGLVTLNLRGIQCVPAAGTALFQIKEMTEDDGDQTPTHFGCEWQGKADNQRVVLPGYNEAEALPEMHCWLWLPKHQELVDFSAGYLPVLAKQMGFNWEIEPPPSFYWARPDSLLPRAVYRPSREATLLAVAKLFAGKERNIR